MLIIEGQKLRHPVMMDGGLNGRKAFEMQGEGFFDDLGRFVKRGLRTGVKQGKQLLPSLAKHLGPTVLSVLASEGAKAASKAGAPDALANLISEGGQRAAQAVSKANIPKQSPQQAAVSGFVNTQADQLLQNLLAKKVGSGARSFRKAAAHRRGGALRPLGGKGLRPLGGKGLRPLGSGLEEVSAKRIN